jgi:hypothetical protein
MTSELLLGSWGPQIVAYTRQYPWQVFAVVLVGLLLLHSIFSRRQSSGGVGGDLDFFDGDGGSCGD